MAVGTLHCESSVNVLCSFFYPRAGQAAGFNAGQAATANNLQTGMWSYANGLNMLSNIVANGLNLASQTSAQKYNSAEAAANSTLKDHSWKKT
jgi:hypothetical protein